MKIFAYTCCALSYIVSFAIVALEFYGHHIWATNRIMMLIATTGWTMAAIYEYRKDKYGK